MKKLTKSEKRRRAVVTIFAYSISALFVSPFAVGVVILQKYQISLSPTIETPLCSLVIFVGFIGILLAYKIILRESKRNENRKRTD